MKRRGLLCVVLAIALVLVPVSAFAAEKPGVVYTALGDSIGAGTGGTGGLGYTDLLADHLERTRGSVTFNNWCADGLTSAQLSAMVQGSGTALVDADLITISIGGNDLLQPLIQFAMANPMILIPGYLETLESWQLQALLGPLFTQLDHNAAGFGGNLAATMTYIRMVNPDAEIHVNTLYTPVRPDHVLYGLVDPYIQTLNAVINGYSYAGTYEVVDVYGTFAAYGNPRKLLVWDLTNPQLALHPTDLGYKFMYNLHKDALGVQ